MDEVGVVELHACGMTLHAVPLTPSARPQVRKLFRNANDLDSIFGVFHHPLRDALIDEWCHDASAECNVMLLAPNGTPIAVARVCEGGLSYLVDPDFRQRGIGKAMIEWLLTLPRFHGAWLYAHVARDNVASRRTLEATGFRFVGLGACDVRGQPVLNFSLYCS